MKALPLASDPVKATGAPTKCAKPPVTTAGFPNWSYLIAVTKFDVYKPVAAVATMSPAVLYTGSPLDGALELALTVAVDATACHAMPWGNEGSRATSAETNAL
jgi:hypothetical protein